ncbi:MAG: hypothetical protein IPO07_21175 [Haliscomenobacter sp.]|nr:hypothetical protein [Haliscomenobacter sp.]MBK9491022.1 hypothetical protein [Haliscomenobacter sp.]
MALSTQNQGLPYREIPDYPETYTASSVAARMIDGLGFRFYWATEGLRPEDLAFRPTPEARSSEETIDHIMGLTNMILNALKNQPNVRSGEETSALTFEVKRKKNLGSFKGSQYFAQKVGLKSSRLRHYPPKWNRQNRIPFLEHAEWPTCRCPVARWSSRYFSAFLGESFQW